MKKFGKMLLIGVLFLAVGFLSFAGATVFSSLFFQTATAENDAATLTAIAEPVINPAASPQYDSPDYGFTYLTYRVKRGDNLTDVAWRHSGDLYKISADEIAYLNKIKNPNRILAGQKLLLPMYYAKEIAKFAETKTAEVAVTKTAAKNTIAYYKKTWKIVTFAVFGIGTIIGAFLFSFLWPLMNKNAAARVPVTKSTESEPEKFLTYPDEIQALLQKCTGQEIADILESEFVEIPRGPGSDATNKVKVKNISDVVKKYPELSSMPPELWHGYIFAEINKTAPAKETA